MSDGQWWNSGNLVDYGGGDGVSQLPNEGVQTSASPLSFDQSTTYSPPGESAPLDQYNYVPDPNSPGGYQTYGPGQLAPIESGSFNNASGQYPNDQAMANAISNNIDYTPTITADGAANIGGGFTGLPESEQGTWNAQYGAQAAPYIWAQQAGLDQQQIPAGFGSLPQDQQNTWYGTYGQYAPQVWQQQSQANQAMQGMMGQFPFMGYYPQSQGGGTVAPDTWNPANPQQGRGEGWGTIGAGTNDIQYGYGVPGFGQDLLKIDPNYLSYLANPNVAPGYIPGSGTYNQRPLDTPGLFGMIAGQPSNFAYGSGGVGDPTTGLEPQTPQEWVQGGKLFNSTRTANWGQADQAGTGLGYIANLFLRSDTPSGIGTPAWSAPQQYWQGLGQQVTSGQIQPTNRGWAAMAAHGITPQMLGPAAVQQAQSVGVGANGQGATGAAGGGAGQGPMGAGTQAFNYQAAYLDYLSARMKNLEIPGMNQLDQREHDKLAFEQAKQAWLEKYQNMTFGEGQRQFDLLQGLRQGELTGTYNGQATLGQQQLNNQTALGYLNLMSQLRGPGDIFQYLKVLNGTPGGIRDIVNAAAGAYRMPTTGGANVTVGGGVNTGGPAGLNSILDQLNNPNYGQEAQNLNLPLPNQINALALQRMTPAQQQSLMAAYEAAGYNPQDVLSIFKNSLPQYAGQGQAGRVALFGR